MPETREKGFFYLRNHCMIFSDLMDQPERIPTVWDLIRNRSVLARWNTQFDVELEMPFWYIIKERHLGIEGYAKKRRREIRVAEGTLDVRIIDRATMAAKAYPILHEVALGYRSVTPVSEAEFQEDLASHPDNCEYWGIFMKGTDQMVGYCVNRTYPDYCAYSVEKILPEYRKFFASLYVNFVMDGYYLARPGIRFILAGARSLIHETHIQDFLIEKCGYRKAYCQCRVKFLPLVPTALRLANLLGLERSRFKRLADIVRSLNYHRVLQQLGDHFDINFLGRPETVSLEPIQELQKTLRLEIFTPSFSRISLTRLNLREKCWNLCMLLLHTLRGKLFKVAYLLDGDKVVHFNYFHDKNFRFQHMANHDISIGPGWTHPDYRGRGIQPAVLSYLVATWTTEGRRVHTSVFYRNKPSLRGTQKAGFYPVSLAVTTKYLRIFRPVYTLVGPEESRIGPGVKLAAEPDAE
jgi:RimJ/RimL family protein N-acetyltransferase